jgi:hypothetical protein
MRRGWDCLASFRHPMPRPAYSGAHGRPQHAPLPARPDRRRRPRRNRRMARRLPGAGGQRRAGNAPASSSTSWPPQRPAPAGRLVARAGHALRQHHRGGAASRFPGRPGHRGKAGLADALERAGDGGARQRRLWRTGRPHRQLRQRGRPVRGRLQSFLPGPQRAAGRRPGVLPAAQRTRRVCARLPRRPPDRRTTSPTTARRSPRRGTARAGSPAIRIPG